MVQYVIYPGLTTSAQALAWLLQCLELTVSQNGNTVKRFCVSDRMEHVGKMCTPCRRERQLEQRIRQDSINLIPLHLQEHASSLEDQAPSTPGHGSVQGRKPSRKGNTLHKRRKRGDQAMNALNQQVEQHEADTETTLNAQGAIPTRPSTHYLTNELDTAKKPTWLRSWLGKLLTNTSNDSSPQTPKSAHLPRIFSFGRAQKTDQSHTPPKSRRSDTQKANSRSLSSIFCFRQTQQPDSPSITTSNSTQPTTLTTPQTPPRATASPRASSLNIPRETKEVTTNAKRKRRSLNVHWRNSVPSTSEHLLEDQQQQQHAARRNKRSSRRDSAGIWNEAVNGGENVEEWYDADDPDRLLLENWSLHHRALVEDWQGN